MWKVRHDEPNDAFLAVVNAPQHNRYGKPIELVLGDNALAGKSLNINFDSSIGTNPDRYKQHGFYFNADNCIACHACESACSEKNDLPAHLAFRAVGYVEGGSYPDYHRLNISMACNHCDDPVCLKGCPTRAYTKFAEYGAVLQDPDICFGCGYCTWVCPYNAPQLDPVKGQVEKCNMCVDRLEVGLKPACVAACLAGALDFGVIETTPALRQQLNVSIPGFPTPEITHPNIRFQQTKSLPREMYRTDAMPLRYERDDHGQYHAVAIKPEAKREWNLADLSSRENPLIMFTLLSQLSVGGFLLMAMLSWIYGFGVDPQLTSFSGLTLWVILGVQLFALVMSTIHLGKPLRFYRGFNNLRYSPVSREAAALMVFFSCLGISALFYAHQYFNLPIFGNDFVIGALQLFSVLGSIAGVTALYFMQRIYRIPARPFWNHPWVLFSFYGAMAGLGAIIIGLFASFAVAIGFFGGEGASPIFKVAAILGIAGVVLEAVGLLAHAQAMKRASSEGGASFARQTSYFGLTYWFRNLLLILAGIGFAALLYIPHALAGSFTLWLILTLIYTSSAIIGRALFYVLVIPTTMPGAFFWRNKTFEKHARDTGLAEMPQVGVIMDSH